MEFGKIREDGTAHYASGVAVNSPEELDRFYDRVNRWALASGVVMGEGTVSIQENTSGSGWPIHYVLLAPTIEGDASTAFYVSLDQTAAS